MSETPGEPPQGWTPPAGATPPTWGQQPPPSPPGWGGPPPQSAPGWGGPPQSPPGWGQQPPQQPAWGQPPPSYYPPRPGWQQPPKPGVIPLRPMAVGEILDGAFTTMRRYPRATLGLSAIVASFGAVLQFFLALSVRNSATGDIFDPVPILVSLVGLVISGLASLVLTGMLTVIVGEAVLGRPIDLGQVWTRVRPRVGSLIGAAILVFLTIALGFIALIVPGIYLAVGLSFTTPALILEGQSVTAAMGRSRELVKGDWWRVFGILLLAGIIASIVGGVISLPFVAASGGGNAFQLGAEPVELSTTALAVQAVGQIVSKTVTAPITAGVTVLLYIDRRMRREGLDVALARAAMPAAPVAPGQGW